MMMLYDTVDAEYFWADFIFGCEKSVVDALEAVHRCFTEEGMAFKFCKGNDTQLNYTLFDRESGVRWMVDMYEAVRDSHGKSPRRHEYLMAAYESAFTVPEDAPHPAGSHIEAGEVLAALQYNGRWVMRRETFSIVVFFSKNGVLGAGEHDFQRENFRRAINLFRRLWLASSPVFCWMDIAPHLYSESVEQVSKGRAPTAAWFSISSGRVHTPDFLRAVETHASLALDTMQDGAMFVENTKCRRGKLKYL